MTIFRSDSAVSSRIPLRFRQGLCVIPARLNGIGPETADSILLYALDRPVFVVDAYTKRFLKRHGLYDGDYGYHDVQKFFMDNLPRDVYIFNEFHALIVRLCQEHCKKRPDCSLCPVAGGGVIASSDTAAGARSGRV